MPRSTQKAADQFARGFREVQFRDFTLTPEESRALFLNTDQNKNLLRQVGNTIPTAGAEHTVTFRGTAGGDDLRARVQMEDGQLRARLNALTSRT